MKHELNTTILVTRAPISNFIGRCLQFGLLGELYRIVNYSRVEFFFFFFLDKFEIVSFQKFTPFSFFA